MITFKIMYSHSEREETWQESDFFCPSCGSKEVWEEVGAGDFYVGNQHICTSCNSTFLIPTCYKIEDVIDDQRLTGLKNHEDCTKCISSRAGFS